MIASIASPGSEPEPSNESLESAETPLPAGDAVSEELVQEEGNLVVPSTAEQREEFRRRIDALKERAQKIWDYEGVTVVNDQMVFAQVGDGNHVQVWRDRNSGDITRVSLGSPDKNFAIVEMSDGAISYRGEKPLGITEKANLGTKDIHLARDKVSAVLVQSSDDAEIAIDEKSVPQFEFTTTGFDFPSPEGIIGDLEKAMDKIEAGQLSASIG